MQSNAATGFGFFAGGAILLGGGFALFRWVNLQRIATYIAEETSPAMKIGSEAMAEGLSKGLMQSGGIPIKMSGQPTESAPKLMIKYQSCGTLNDEQATFCDHCGQPL